MSAELNSFCEHVTDMFVSIKEPTTLSLRLFSAGLLSQDMKQTICSFEKPPEQRLKLLIDAVEGQIMLDPQNFYKFVDELEKDSPMQHLCDKLRSTCGECDNVCQSTSTDQWCSGVAERKSTQPVTLPPNTSGKQKMCVWWNNM